MDTGASLCLRGMHRHFHCWFHGRTSCTCLGGSKVLCSSARPHDRDSRRFVCSSRYCVCRRGRRRREPVTRDRVGVPRRPGTCSRNMSWDPQASRWFTAPPTPLPTGARKPKAVTAVILHFSRTISPFVHVRRRQATMSPPRFSVAAQGTNMRPVRAPAMDVPVPGGCGAVLAAPGAGWLCGVAEVCIQMSRFACTAARGLAFQGAVDRGPCRCRDVQPRAQSTSAGPLNATAHACACCGLSRGTCGSNPGIHDTPRARRELARGLGQTEIVATGRAPGRPRQFPCSRMRPRPRCGGRLSPNVVRGVRRPGRLQGS